MKTNSTGTPQDRRQRTLDGFVSTRQDYRGYTTIGHAASSHVPAFSADAMSPQSVPQLKDTTRANIAPAYTLQTELPHFEMPRYEPPEHPLKIVRKRRQWFWRAVKVTALSSAVLAVLLGGLVWRGYANLQKVFRGTTTVAALSAKAPAPELLKGEGDGRVNILLLGVGGKGHDGGDLTDTMMVLSVDPVNNKAAMLSVPRDMWVKMPINYFGAYQKINAAYSSGKYKYLGKVDIGSDNQSAVQAGFASVDQAVSEVLGIHINYHVLVDFQAFRQAVDTVGGVTLDVKDQLYDPTMAWENSNNPVLAPTGVQTMTGTKALMFARSRETSSDFARGERQRQLLVALKQKVLSLGTLSSPTKIDSLMAAFGNNVRTDLSTQAASRLYAIMKKINDADIASLSLTEPDSLITTDRVGNASVVRPKAGFNTYSTIQTFVRSHLVDGYLLKEHAAVYVVGATEALRAHTVDTLGQYGYSIAGSKVAVSVPTGATIVDVTDGSMPYTQHYLQDRYGIAATSTLPAGLEVPAGAQFVIIAGT